MKNKENDRQTTVKYSLLQIFYWAQSSAVFVFSGKYLQNAGLINGQIGIFLAFSNILTFALSGCLAVIMDRAEKGSSRRISIVLLLTQLGLSIAIFFLYDLFPFATATAYMMLITLMLTAGIIYNVLYSDLVLSGKNVNFSAARGLGSLSMAVSSILFGVLTERYSVCIIPFCAIVTVFAELIVILFIGIEGNGLKAEKQTMHEKNDRLLPFLRTNHGFVLLLLGIMLIFAGNGAVNNFLYLVVENVGGGERVLGNIQFVVAISELVMMEIYPRISSRRLSLLLQISLVFFPLKLLGISLANSVGGLYAANILQALSFGLFTPALVDWVRNNISKKDSGKGQSLAGSIKHIGIFVSTLVFGFLFDGLSVKICLLIMIVLMVIGATIGIMGIRIQLQDHRRTE